AIEIYPNNTLQRNNVALYSLYAGETVAAAQEARTVLQQNRAFEKAYIALALSQALEGKLDEAAQTYEQLRGISARGASMALTGLADLAVYQGRFSDALRMLDTAPEADSKDPSSASAVSKLDIQAEALLAQGKAAQAARLAERAVTLS